MKLSIFFICFPFLVFSQTERDSNTFFLNEFSISINKTVKNYKLNELGLGFGLYRTVEVDPMIDLSFGLEYNLTNQYFGSLSSGGHGNYTKSDVELTIGAISIPFYLRLNYGEKLNLFLDPGVFIETIYHSKEEGTSQSYYPDVPETKQYSVKANLKRFNAGLSLGFGFRYPIKKIVYSIKADIKYGLINISNYLQPITTSYARIAFLIRIK